MTGTTDRLMAPTVVLGALALALVCLSDAVGARELVAALVDGLRAVGWL